MKDNFFGNDVTCVVLCAGEGTRLFPLTLNQQKSMLEINGKPILHHGIKFWSKFSDDFIFIVSYKKENVYEYLKTAPVKHKTIEQKERKGIANALTLAKDDVSDNFIVVLADCICRGKFKFPKNFSQGFGVFRTKNADDIKRSFSVEIKEDYVSKVVEKPEKIINDQCGMGFYFFNKKVFDYILKTKPSKRTGMIEITDVIQNMIDHGEKISPIYFEGDYLNITYPQDLEYAKQILNK